MASALPSERLDQAKRAEVLRSNSLRSNKRKLFSSVIRTKQTTLFDGWMLRHSNQVRNNKVKQIKEKYYREKADYHCQA